MSLFEIVFLIILSPIMIFCIFVSVYILACIVAIPFAIYDEYKTKKITNKT